MNLIFFLILLAIFIIIFTKFDWRYFVKSVLFIIIIDGALRKWFLPQASNLVYLLKDFVIIIAYIKFFASSQKTKLINNTWISIAHVLLSLVAIWLLVQSFNPDLGSPIVGLFGLSRYLLYVPLMWMVPYLFNSQEELYRFLRNYLLLLIPICILGIAQFYSPASSFLNIAPGGEEADAGLGFGDGKLRISSTFSYPNLYTTYLVVSFGLLMHYLTNQQSIIWRIIIFSELLLMIANFFMTGSRGVLLSATLLLVANLGIKTFYESKKNLKIIGRLAIPAVIMMLILPQWFAPAIDAFSSRGSIVGDSRITHAFYIPPVPNKSFIDGYGTGATQNGGKAIGRFLNLPTGLPTPPAESELHRINIEIGLFGLVLWYAMRLALLMALWSVYRKLKTPFLKDLALIAFLIHILFLPGQVVVHPVAVVYYWFLSGFIFLLPRLEINNYYYQEYKLSSDKLSRTDIANY
ncbi:MAG: hypothetical protein QNJ47_10290 [Nostocaceae cyanobacterium]|nr:hypothetical protein [Nostocaceae cyanobacterium]